MGRRPSATSDGLPRSQPCHLRLHGLHRRRHSCDLHPKGFESRVEDGRETGERLDHVAQDLQRNTGTYGERRLLQPFAGLGPEGVSAGQPGAVAEQGQESVRLGVLVA